MTLVSPGAGGMSTGLVGVAGAEAVRAGAAGGAEPEPVGAVSCDEAWPA
jgi:hypothetical protein